jgi:hypothetical protein
MDRSTPHSNFPPSFAALPNLQAAPTMNRTFPPQVGHSRMNYRVRLIVCERSGLWATRIRPALGRELAMRETRLLADCRAELAAAPASLLVVELRAGNAREVFDLLVEVSATYPLARVVVVASRGSEASEDALREAGAVHFSTSPRTASTITRLAQRHADRVPRSRVGFSDRIWESLPWAEAATS